MLNLKSTAAVSMVFAFFTGASLADDAMPVAYPVTEQAPATSQTCKEANETAAFYRELDRTDGNVPSNEPLPKCDDDNSTKA